jgi:hypothetical protein
MLSKTQWLVIVLIASILGAAGGATAAYRILQAPLQRLSMITPVFVMDRSRMIHELSPNATPEQMASTVAGWKTLSGKLSAAGYLVIDATAVVAAPDDVYVRPEGR